MEECAKIRVMIAEDDPVQSDLLKDALEMEPDMLCCGQAADGLQVLAMVGEQKPDVLLMDIVMPNMDGVDLLHELRRMKLEKQPCVIAISAYGREHVARAVLEQGADWFVLKPYRIDLLVQRIRTFAMQGSPRGNSLERFVARAVMDLGIDTNALGFGYLNQALMILLTHTGPCPICKSVYAQVAEANGTTSTCVEKALRTVVEQAFAADTQALHDLLKLGHKEGVTHLSNARFLTLMATGIRLMNML